MIEVRPGRMEDAAAMATLLGELGYATTAEEVSRRLRRLADDSNVTVLVAVVDGVVAGLATFHLMPVLHESLPRGQITALVVGTGARRKGIGKTLITEIERVAGEAGVHRLVLTTANYRRDAHEFYDGLGYEWTGRRYAKLITIEPATGGEKHGQATADDETRKTEAQS